MLPAETVLKRRLMKAADWITADDSIIAPMVKEAAAKYAAEKNITTGCLMTN